MGPTETTVCADQEHMPQLNQGTCAKTVQDPASKEAALQQRYIELLEKRIAQLEAAVKEGGEKKKDPDPGEKKVDVDKENLKVSVVDAPFL